MYSMNRPTLMIDLSGKRAMFGNQLPLNENPISSCGLSMNRMAAGGSKKKKEGPSVALCPRRAVVRSPTMSVVFSLKSPQQYEIQVTSLIDVQNTEVEWNGVPSAKNGTPRDKASSAMKNKARKGGYDLKYGHISTDKLLAGSVLNVRAENLWNPEHYIYVPPLVIKGEQWPGSGKFFSCLVE